MSDKTQAVSTKQKLLALVALSSTGTLVGIFSKVAQISGRYSFSPASAVVCTEAFKLIISLTIIVRLLLRGELVDRSPQEQQELEKEAAKSGTTSDADVEDRINSSSPLAHTIASKSRSFNKRYQVLLADWKDFWKKNATVPVLCHEFGLAAAYCVVNIVTYAIFIHASGSMFFLLKASSPVVTAALLYLMVNRKISKPQWIAVAMQCYGLLGTQLNPCGSTVAVSITGYVLILVNVIVSCAAGVWNEHIIKNYGTSVNAQNAILYTFGVLINLCLFLFAPPKWIGGGSVTSINADGEEVVRQLGFFEGYNFAVLAVIMANGSVGLVITMVYKYADVVIKTFGLAGSTMTLFLLETAGIIPGGRSMPLTTTLSGAAVVFYASYIYILPSKDFEPSPPIVASGQQQHRGGDSATVSVNIEGNSSEGTELINGTTSQPPPPPLPFDVMAMTWRAAMGNKRVKVLFAAAVFVILSFSAQHAACQLGM